MTPDETLTVWRELLDITRLIAAVEAQLAQPRAAREWRAGLAALEHRRAWLAYVLSLERQEVLDAVYARLASEVRPASPMPELPMRGVMH